MTPPRFIQLHTLTSYPAALLNRDDAGFAKRIPFGGAVRTRVSSQCLKRHWRCFKGQSSLSALGQPMSVRSRLTFDALIAAPLIAEGAHPAATRHIVHYLKSLVLTGKPPEAKAKTATRKPNKKEAAAEESAAKAEPKEAASLRSEQVTVLGRPEVDYLRQLTHDLLQEASAVLKELRVQGSLLGGATDEDEAPLPAATASKLDDLLKDKTKGLKETLKGLGLAAGLDAAMFGRMVTSDILARGDAAIHVAHAFTVHAEASESDYFSAVDDLLSGEGELGSGHINTSELTTGLFYGYVVIDVPLLVSNLTGCPQDAWLEADRHLAGQLAARMLRLATTVSPGAKLGSTAPHGYASCALVECDDAQPRSLANAFLRPVKERPDLLANAYDALGRHLTDLDAMYGPTAHRRLAGIGPIDPLQHALGLSRQPLDAIEAWLAAQVSA